MVKQGNSMTGMISYMMAFKGQDNRNGNTNAKNRPNYKGVEKGVDEATTRALYTNIIQKDPMKVGALHTIIADG
eukprot:7451755-Heterocapsa_arctica.AAC.1